VISFKRWEVLSQCGCEKRREKKVAWPREANMQQSSTQSREPESAAKKEVKERDVRRMFKILREVWLDVGIEKVDMHKGITVKTLLDSSTMGMFMDREMAKRYGFKMMKMEQRIVEEISCIRWKSMFSTKTIWKE